VSESGNHKRERGVRRLLLAAGYALSLAAVAALASGATYGFFSATSPGEENAFSTGTVTLSSGTSGSCAVSNLLPTSPPSTCTLQATYTGSAPAYLAVDVLVQTQPGAGGTALYDPSGSGGLQVTISSTNPTVAAYSLPVTPAACPPSAPASSTCFALQNALVATTPFTSASPQVSFSTTVGLPASSPTVYQGGSAQIVLHVHAAQAGHNGNVAACTAGQPCAAVSWS
jgi:hypothetical protein